MEGRVSIISLTTNSVANESHFTEMSYEERLAYLQGLENGQLIVFSPPNPCDKIVMICPGGGLSHINTGHEGYDAAMWFNARHITFAVLKYRFPSELENGPLHDTAKAMKLLERFYPEYSMRGIMGASVGGYLSATIATQAKVDFQILMYPVLSMRDGLTHVPTREKLFGKELSEEEKVAKSLELLVEEKMPKTFLVAAADDPIVPPASSCLYSAQMLELHQSISLHIYPEGGHSFGFKPFAYSEVWMMELEKWLDSLG